MKKDRLYINSKNRPDEPKPAVLGDVLSAAVRLDDAIESQVAYHELSRVSSELIALVRRVHVRLVSKGTL